MIKPIWQWSATQTAAAIRAGEISCTDVITAHIVHMRKVNPALNAVVRDLGDQAIQAAKAADEQQARCKTLGPLHGLPVTIKINTDVKGEATTNGVPAMAGLIAPSDAPVVSALKQAGAIIIGLTNAPEFSLRIVTDNPLHGLTLNPWDADITCGGSSGGAASALAAGIGVLAQGNDIGGSLRWPAHCNGVATIRPTLGRVAAYNESAAAERPHGAQLMSVQGPIARCIDDIALALDAMTLRDPRDPWWSEGQPVSGVEVQPHKVALAKIPQDMNPDPTILEHINRAAEALSAEGYEVETVEVPDLLEVWERWAELLIGEIVALQEPAMRALTSTDFHAVLDSYKAFANPLDLTGYMRNLASRSTHLRRWMALLEEYPVILTPVSVQPAFAARADTEGPEHVREMFRNAMRFVGVVNYLGLPAATVPVGLNNGQPVGVQLIATRFREDIALAAANAIERQVGTLCPKLWANPPCS